MKSRPQSAGTAPPEGGPRALVPGRAGKSPVKTIAAGTGIIHELHTIMEHLSDIR